MCVWSTSTGLWRNTEIVGSLYRKHKMYMYIRTQPVCCAFVTLSLCCCRFTDYSHISANFILCFLLEVTLSHDESLLFLITSIRCTLYWCCWQPLLYFFCLLVLFWADFVLHSNSSSNCNNGWSFLRKIFFLRMYSRYPSYSQSNYT